MPIPFCAGTYESCEYVMIHRTFSIDFATHGNGVCTITNTSRKYFLHNQFCANPELHSTLKSELEEQILGLKEHGAFSISLPSFQMLRISVINEWPRGLI